MKLSYQKFKKNYIPEIQELAFNFPYVLILGIHHCGKESHKYFKNWSKENNILFQSDCIERIVTSFAQQIQSEYYGWNRYVFIERISLEHCSDSNQSGSSLKYEIVSH